MRSRIQILLVFAAVVAAGVVHGAEAAATVSATRPRLWVTPQALPDLKQRAEAGGEAWKAVQARLPAPDAPPAPFYRRTGFGGPPKLTGAVECALSYLLAGNRQHGREAVAILLDQCNRGEAFVAYAVGAMGASLAGSAALAYDWCHDLMTAAERAIVIAGLNRWALWCMDQPVARFSPSTTEFYRFLWVQTAVALATWGENPEAERILIHARDLRLRAAALPWLARNGLGGDWPEGNACYDGPLFLACALAALKTATGEDLFGECAFLKDSVRYHQHATLPAIAGKVSIAEHFREKPEAVQTHFDRGPVLLYPSGAFPLNGYGLGWNSLGRVPEHAQTLAILSWGLAGADPDGARLAQRWTARTPPGLGGVLGPAISFFFHNAVPELTPAGLPNGYLAKGTGFFAWRSSWERDAVFFAFTCGPRLAAHQACDANGIFIHRRGDLLGHVPGPRLDTANSVSLLIGGRGQTVMPRNAEPRLLACRVTADYTYVAGQAAGAYNSTAVGRKICESFTRQVVILPPGLFIVCDRVRPANEEDRAEFLSFFGDRSLAGQDRLYARGFGAEPSAEKSPILVSQSDWGGRAYLRFLLPRDSQESVGKVRLAFHTAAGGPEQRFLTVVYVPVPEEPGHPSATLVDDGGGDFGVEGEYGDRRFRILFSGKGLAGGRLEVRHNEQPAVSAALEPDP